MENTNINTPASTPYADKLKAIEEQVAGIRTQAASIADQQNKPELASQIRSSGRTVNAPLAVGASVTNPIINGEQFRNPDNAAKAITSISSKANAAVATSRLSLPVDDDENELSYPALSVPGYFTDGRNSDWQTIANELKKAAANPFSREEKLKQEYKDWGVNETFDLLRTVTVQSISIKKELDKLDQQEKADLSRIEQTPGGSLSIYGAEQSRVSREYAFKKAPLAATLAGYAAQAEMLRGNVQLAKSYANDLVDAATYDAESKAKAFQGVKDFYEDTYDKLDAQYKLVFDAAKDKAEKEYAQQRKEREKIVDWATNIETSPALLNRDLGKISFDEASNLVRDYLTMHAIKNGEDLLSVDETKKLKVPYGTTKAQAASLGIIPQTDETGDAGFWTAIRAGVNELQQGSNWGEVWNRVKMQFPNVADSKIDNALGGSWKEPGAYEQFKAKTKSNNTFVVGNPNFQWDLSE